MVEPEESSSDSGFRSSLKYSDAGLRFILCVLICFFGGRWLDQYLGTSDLLAILGMFGGFGLGTYTLYQSLFKES